MKGPDMNIRIARIYDDDTPAGYRILADRLWPRGIAKAEARLDAHWKEFAPSDALRRWFGHDAEKWAEFRKKYMHELSEQKERIKACLAEAKGENLVLLYAAKDEKHNNAVVLKEYLEKLGKPNGL